MLARLERGNWTAALPQGLAASLSLARRTAQSPTTMPDSPTRRLFEDAVLDTADRMRLARRHKGRLPVPFLSVARTGGDGQHAGKTRGRPQGN